MKKILFIVAMSFLSTYAQIDTSDYYPLAIGNKWEYSGNGLGYETVEIIGDTLMPNGKTYFIFNGGVSTWKYQRKEGSTRILRYCEAFGCGLPEVGHEHILFDFSINEKTIFDPSMGFYCWGLYNTWSNYNALFKTSLENYEYSYVLIDSTSLPPDTLWNPIVDVYTFLLTKTVGVSSYSYGLAELVGAKINGVGYGTLVNINEEERSTINEYKLFQNYPNPFNASTKISYQLLKNTNISLKVYDVLGKEIVELYNGEQTDGMHSISFEASNLASGFYIITLACEGHCESIIATLMK